MRILEILLPKGVSDRDLSPRQLQKVDMIQARMDKYVDAIKNPNTSQAGRDFLISKLRDDYYELRDTIPRTHAVAENDTTKYEVYDRRSGEKVSGPYTDRKRASRAADKKDLEYGAVRYGYRPVKSLTEAVTKLPLTVKDFDLAKKIMERPIPAIVAPIYIHEIIEDDALDAQIESLVETEPNRDVRPIIAEWFERVMPDQMYHFVDIEDSEQRQKGLLSPIHGYDPHMYKGTNDPITGNAFGRFN